MQCKRIQDTNDAYAYTKSTHTLYDRVCTNQIMWNLNNLQCVYVYFVHAYTYFLSCMCTYCMYDCVFVCINVYTYVCLHKHTNDYKFMCMCDFTCNVFFRFICIRATLYIRVYMYIYIYIYICIYI